MAGHDILFSVIPGAGHYNPMLPLARALQERGHDVRFASSEPYRDRVDADGFGFVPVGHHWTQNTVLDAIDGDDMASANIRMFYFENPPKVLASLEAMADTWTPDVVVLDPWEFGAQVWAEANDIPWALVNIQVRTGPLFGLYLPHDISEREAALLSGARAAMDRFRADVGLGPVPVLVGESMGDRMLSLDQAPPGLSPWEPRLFAHTSHPLRPETHRSDVGAPWLADVDTDRTVVHAAFGSLFADTTPAFRLTVEALSDPSIQLIIAAPEHADVGDVPDHAILTTWVPQHELLPLCDAVVHHGGWGATTGAIEHGIPSVAVPHSGDQWWNARCIASSGTGVMLPLGTLTADGIRQATTAVTNDPLHRMNAERLRASLLSMPTAQDCVPLVERLAVERRPILAPPPVL